MPEKFRVAMNRRVGVLLKEYSEKIGQTFRHSLHQAILDYINVLSYIKSSNPDSDLEKLFLSMESQSDLVLTRIEELRVDFRKRRKQDALLLDKDLPKLDNLHYIIEPIPEFLYDKIKSLLKKYPSMYNKKATIKDVVNRAILFRVIKNENLINNNVYKEWRAAVLLQSEHDSKIDLVDVVEKISYNRKVKFKKDT
jgi:hypothetical protein